MKKIIISTVAAAVLLTAGSIMASDYSNHSTEELSKMRGTMQNAPAEEREAFIAEWQERTRSMTQEERQEYMGRGQGKGRWNDDYNDEYRRGKKSGNGTGYGSGNGYGKSNGRGMGSGRY